MKRVVINALSVDDGVSGHMWRVVYGTESHEFFLIGKTVVAGIEDVNDPLPTGPGVRFWGKPQDHPAEWWFIQEFQGLWYMSSGGFCWDEKQAQRNGLVRLPDPEATP